MEHLIKLTREGIQQHLLAARDLVRATAAIGFCMGDRDAWERVLRFLSALPSSAS